MKKKNPAANHRRIVELDQVVGVKVPLLSQVPARLVKIGCDGQFWNMYLNAVTLEISQLLMAEGFANFVQPLNIYLIVITSIPTCEWTQINDTTTPIKYSIHIHNFFCIPIC